MVLGGEGWGVIQSQMDSRTQPRTGPLTLNPALSPEVVRVSENQHTTGCLAISSASSRVNFGASPLANELLIHRHLVQDVEGLAVGGAELLKAGFAEQHP